MAADKKLSHIDESGQAKMVNVGQKEVTERVAIVRSVVYLAADTFDLLENKALPKGDVLTVAKVAGIQGAKQTAQLIPLCHPLFLSYIDVNFHLNDKNYSILVEAEARTNASTGVEMEALVAAQVAAMTIYDMCKAVQRDIAISDCRLVYKSGGRSGTFDLREEK
jgi:cyclic pyranopterin phosphate synthase